MDDDEVTELMPVPQAPDVQVTARDTQVTARDTQVIEIVGFEATEVGTIPVAAVSARANTETDVAIVVPARRLRAPRAITETDAVAITGPFARLGTPAPVDETTGVLVVSRRLPTEAEWPPSPREPASLLPAERRAAIYASVPDDELLDDPRSPDDWY